MTWLKHNARRAGFESHTQKKRMWHFPGRVLASLKQLSNWNTPGCQVNNWDSKICGQICPKKWLVVLIKFLFLQWLRTRLSLRSSLHIYEGIFWKEKHQDITTVWFGCKLYTCWIPQWFSVKKKPMPGWSDFPRNKLKTTHLLCHSNLEVFGESQPATSDFPSAFGLGLLF